MEVKDEVVVESGNVDDNQQQEQTNGASLAPAESNNTPATPDSKQENRSVNKDSGRDGGRSSRRDRDRGNRSRRRSRSRERSPVRGGRGIVARRVYVANLDFGVKWTELKGIFDYIP